MGHRPLYTPVGHAAPATCPTGAHPGLWYDKFCNTWIRSGGGWHMRADATTSPKRTWMATLVGVDGRQTNPVTYGDPTVLGPYAHRLALLALTHGGRIAVFHATSRFVAGLGRSHPVENGFAWHPTLGTPYLPGSSLKGMARAQAGDELAESAEGGLVEQGDGADDIERVFGPEKAGRVGTVAFHDAVPVAPVPLEADVMTPHYAGWDEEHPPGDWCAPTPIPFLVAAEGTTLLVALTPRGSRDDLAKAWGWVSRALTEEGAGAKTAVGYGRFREDSVSTQNQIDRVHTVWQERETARRTATPEGRAEYLVDHSEEEDLVTYVRRWFAGGEPPSMTGEPAPDSEAELLAFARELCHRGYVGSWQNGENCVSKTSSGAKKLKERARDVRKVLDRHRED